MLLSTGYRHSRLRRFLSVTGLVEQVSVLQTAISLKELFRWIHSGLPSLCFKLFSLPQLEQSKHTFQDEQPQLLTTSGMNVVLKRIDNSISVISLSTILYMFSVLHDCLKTVIVLSGPQWLWHGKDLCIRRTCRLVWSSTFKRSLFLILCCHLCNCSTSLPEPCAR